MARMASQSTTRQIRAEKYWNWTKKQPGPEKIQGQLQPPEGCSPCFGRPTLVQGQGPLLCYSAPPGTFSLFLGVKERCWENQWEILRFCP